MKKIKITERQKELLIQFELNEGNDYDLFVKRIVDDLTLNYEPVVGTYRKGGEYFEKPIIKVNADGTTITPKDLLKYLKFKNKSLGVNFIKQIILDWVNGEVSNDYKLSKNISIN